MALNTVFEKEVCGRCGGSGQYSYNQVDGSRCYGGGGKGERLTKRGSAASAFYSKSLTVEADCLKVGDIIRCEQANPFTGTRIRYSAPIVEIGDAHGLLKITTASAKYGKNATIGFKEYVIVLNEDERNAKIAAALEYQASLTKSATLRKKA